jgi:hypothetical protein
MEKEDAPFLMQLVNSLEDSELKLERAYNTKDSARFNEVKKLMLQIQEQISEIIK